MTEVKHAEPFFAETVGSGQNRTKFRKKGLPINVSLHCAWCGVAPGTLVKCQGCKIARYCGPVCQALHWKDKVQGHKQLCRAVYDRVMLYPTDNPQEDRIHCMWMKSQAEALVAKAIQARFAQQAEASP